MRIDRHHRGCWLLLCLLVWALPAWSWQLVAVDDVPAGVAARLPLTVDYQAGREQRRYFELRPEFGSADSGQFLVLERDRGQRVWIFDESTHLLQELPLGAAHSFRWIRRKQSADYAS